jgi:hypothetical protein
MRFNIRTLAAHADSVDLSDLTNAHRTGPAFWDPDEAGVLEIPFDRDLTDAERDAITNRLSAPEPEDARAEVAAYLNLTSPSGKESENQIRALTRLVLELIAPTTTT